MVFRNESTQQHQNFSSSILFWLNKAVVRWKVSFSAFPLVASKSRRKKNVSHYERKAKFRIFPETTLFACLLMCLQMSHSILTNNQFDFEMKTRWALHDTFQVVSCLAMRVDFSLEFVKKYFHLSRERDLRNEIFWITWFWRSRKCFLINYFVGKCAQGERQGRKTNFGISVVVIKVVVCWR